MLCMYDIHTQKAGLFVTSSNKFIMTLYKGILQYEQQRDVTKYVFISTTVITSHQMDSC